MNIILSVSDQISDRPILAMYQLVRTTIVCIRNIACNCSWSIRLCNHHDCLYVPLKNLDLSVRSHRLCHAGTYKYIECVFFRVCRLCAFAKSIQRHKSVL